MKTGARLLAIEMRANTAAAEMTPTPKFPMNISAVVAIGRGSSASPARGTLPTMTHTIAG